MAGWTNKGKYMVLGAAFRNETIPGGAFAVFLALAADAPTVDDAVKTDVSEIAVNNGYSAGGLNVERSSVGWDVWTQVDASDYALIQIKDLVWTASGGNIPASGNGARYACLTDQNATVGSRAIWGWWDLTSDRTISDTQTLTLQNCELRITE